MLGREPVRSRILIVATAVVVALAAGGEVYAARIHSAGWRALADTIWFVLLLAIVVSALVLSVLAAWRMRSQPRPVRFALTAGGFLARPLMPAWPLAAIELTITGTLGAALPGIWHGLASGPGDHPGAYPSILAFLLPFGLMCLLTAVVVAVAWRGVGMELTPAGLGWRLPLLYRFVPWTALAPGGPPRPRPGARTLRLVVARPELVVQRGWLRTAGSRREPVVDLRVDTHPWLVADAIRWYVDHPDDRAGIGTAEGHERLIAALSVWQPAAPRPGVPPHQIDPAAG